MLAKPLEAVVWTDGELRLKRLWNQEGILSPERDMMNDGDEDVEKCTNAWDVYVTMAESADKDLTDSWEKGIDVLLVYAALFSSVLASFLLQSFALTQPNPADLTNALLQDLSQSLRNASPTTALPIPHVVSSKALWINGLWFASLVCALSASFFAMLARQWVQEYKRWMTAHPEDVHAKARLRHFRHLGVQRWRVSTVIWTLPFILHVSLLLFFAGLVLFATLADRTIALVSGVLVAFTLSFYITTLALPLFIPQCPFQTPPIRSLQNLSIRSYRWALQAALYLSQRLSSPTTSASNFIQAIERRLLTLHHTRLSNGGDEGGKEAWLIDDSKESLDAQVLASLISTSWDKSDKLIADALTTLVLPSHSSNTGTQPATAALEAQNILRASDAARLIERSYLGLLRLSNDFPHLSIALGRDADAYTYLRALLHLCEHDAVPADWQPSNRLRHSLHSCKKTGDRNMKSVVLALIDRLDDNGTGSRAVVDS